MIKTIKKWIHAIRHYDEVVQDRKNLWEVCKTLSGDTIKEGDSILYTIEAYQEDIHLQRHREAIETMLKYETSYESLLDSLHEYLYSNNDQTL